MWPYWLVFGVSAILVLVRRRLPPAQARWIWILFSLILSMWMGLRHEVGGDWWRYASQFAIFRGMSFADAMSTAKDPGYSLVGWLASEAGGSIHTLNFVCALALASGTVALARRQPWPALAILAAVPYLLIVVGMGYTRQSAAIGFAMLGLAALGEQRQRAFVLWVLVAATFHKTAVLLLPIAALSTTHNRAWTFAWVGAIFLLGGGLFLHESSERLIANYVESEYADASQGAAVRVFMNAVPSLLAIVFRGRLFPVEAERNLWTWMSIISLGCIPLLAVSATAVDRMALYFIPLQLVVFACLPRLATTVSARTLLVIGLIFYYALVQFVWLNFASHAYAWLPYRFALPW